MNTTLVRRLAFKLENHNVLVWHLEVYLSESSVCTLYTITLFTSSALACSLR